MAAWWRSVRLGRRARRLRSKVAAASDLGAVVDLVLRGGSFKASQKRSEILALLEAVRAIAPRRVLEIGSRKGGNLILFAGAAASDARILSIDLVLPPERRRLHATFAGAAQIVTCFEGDSHAPATLEIAKRWLAGEQLDFLFIDGDHSLEGVRADFLNYSPLVRRGGLIAFHDISPDDEARGLPKTENWAGGVPGFWAEIRGRYPLAREFIERPGQDGYGIGLIEWPGT